MAERTDTLLCVKSRIKDRSDGLLKEMRQWSERRNLLRKVEQHLVRRRYRQQPFL